MLEGARGAGGAGAGKRPLDAAGASPKLDTELCEWLRKWDLEDAEDALAQHGCENMKRLRDVTNEDVEALDLPRFTAKELKKRLEDLKRDLNSKDAKMAEELAQSPATGPSA